MVCQLCGLPMDDCLGHTSWQTEVDYISYEEAEKKIRYEAIAWADQFCDKKEVAIEYDFHTYLVDLMEVKLLFNHSVENVLQALESLLHMPTFPSKDGSKIAQSEFFEELNSVFLRFVSGVAEIAKELESSPNCDCEDCQKDN